MRQSGLSGLLRASRYANWVQGTDCHRFYRLREMPSGELFAALRERGDGGFEILHCSFSGRQLHVVKSKLQQCDLPRPGAWSAPHRLQILRGVRGALHIFALLAEVVEDLHASLEREAAK
jgi:hypothetical protein